MYSVLHYIIEDCERRTTEVETAGEKRQQIQERYSVTRKRHAEGRIRRDEGGEDGKVG